MNKQRFIEYLRKPADLNDQALEDLEDIITDFPYFQSARTLLAKAGKIKKTRQSGKYISSAAIYATDRALLKRYLNDELIFLSPISVHESHEADHERDRSAEIKEKKSASIQSKIKSNPRSDLTPPTRSTVSNVEIKGGDVDKPSKPKPETRTKPEREVPAGKKKETPKSTSEPKTRPVSPQDQDSEKLTDGPSAADQSNSLDQLIDELYRDMEELKVSREKFMEYERQFEEEEAVDEALKKAEKKGQSPVKKEKQEEKDKEDEPLRKAAESRSARGNRQKESPAKSSSSTAPTKKTSTTKSTAKKKPSATKKTTSTTSKGAGKKTGSKKTDSKSTKKDDKKDDKGDPRKTDQNAIISNFIKNNPSISPAGGKTKNEEDLSGESTAFHPEIASEYLAEIYLQQGKKERASEIYKALMLKFPEKKSYFAGLIEKLK